MSSRLRTQHVPRHRRAGVPSSRARLLQASVLMASGSVVSRLLGFVRNFMFGAILAGSMSAAANAFSAANTLPNTIWILVGGGTLNAILVPAIVRAVKRPDRGSDYISRLKIGRASCRERVERSAAEARGAARTGSGSSTPV